MPPTPRDPISSPICSRDFGCRPGPEFGVGAHLGLEEKRPEQKLDPSRYRVPGLGDQVARVLRDGDDAGLANALVEFCRQKPVAHLGGRVDSVPVCWVLAGLLLFEGDAPGRTVTLNDLRRGPDDAHAVGGRRRGGFDDERGEEFGEQVGTEAVDTHVDLIALLVDGADGVLGDAGVVPEDVETGFLSEELFDALSNDGEVV